MTKRKHTIENTPSIDILLNGGEHRVELPGRGIVKVTKYEPVSDIFIRAFQNAAATAVKVLEDFKALVDFSKASDFSGLYVRRNE